VSQRLLGEGTHVFRNHVRVGIPHDRFVVTVPPCDEMVWMTECSHRCDRSVPSIMQSDTREFGMSDELVPSLRVPSWGNWSPEPVDDDQT
jgi:hypothetical protein